MGGGDRPCSDVKMTWPRLNLGYHIDIISTVMLSVCVRRSSSASTSAPAATFARMSRSVNQRDAEALEGGVSRSVRTGVAHLLIPIVHAAAQMSTSLPVGVGMGPPRRAARRPARRSPQTGSIPHAGHRWRCQTTSRSPRSVSRDAPASGSGRFVGGTVPPPNPDPDPVPPPNPDPDPVLPPNPDPDPHFQIQIHFRTVTTGSARTSAIRSFTAPRSPASGQRGRPGRGWARRRPRGVRAAHRPGGARRRAGSSGAPAPRRRGSRHGVSWPSVVRP